jgi:trans-aconitate 2-methyltransferase
MWDLTQYRRFSDERSRPFFDLVSRIGHPGPLRVTDLGCGDGSLTETLAERWPEALVEGVDSSHEMIAAASIRAIPGRLQFRLGDISDWRPAEPADVVVSNAALQWVADHPALLPRWVEALAAGGWLAFQVPGNDDSPSHVILRELQRSPRWRSRLDGAGLPDRRVLEPEGYLQRLAGLGCEVDAWETTYLHVLKGPDPVLEWVKGSALRPVLGRLPEGPERTGFLDEYRDRLREAYPSGDHGTVLPFRRLFVVAHRTG